MDVPAVGVVAHVEGQEARFASLELGAVVNLVQVHGEVRERPHLGAQKARGAVPLLLVLLYGIEVRPAGRRGRALKLEGEERKAVQEHHEIDALARLVVDLLHDGEAVLLEEVVELLVEACRRFGVYEVERHAVKLHAVPEAVEKPTVGDIEPDLADDGLVRPRAVEPPHRLHLLWLGGVQEREQDLAIHGEVGVVVGLGVALTVVVILDQVVNDEPLEGVLVERVRVLHGFRPPYSRGACRSHIRR